MDLLSGAVGGVAGAIVTAGIAYLAVMRGATAQDKRNLRDARSARTRRSLGRLLAVALHIQLVVSEQILTDAPMREQQRKFQEELWAMWPKMLKARAQVLAEPDGLTWMTDFEDLVLLPFGNFRDAVGEGKVDRREEITAAKAGIAKFQASVAAHFATLDEPI